MINIHPTTIIEDHVTIGEGTTIGPFCYIKGPVVIGKNNEIHSHVSIGVDGGHRTKESVGTIKIGDDNVIRDYTTIQRSIGGRDTSVGNDCFIMDYCYIAHDCMIEDSVTISPHVALGGHCVIRQGATIGMGASVHQYTHIGPYAMVGMGSVVVKDVHPFIKAYGNPAEWCGWNTHRIEELDLKGKVQVGMKNQVISSEFEIQGQIQMFYYDRGDRELMQL